MIVRQAGDTMLLVEFEQVVDPAVNERAIRLAERLQASVGAIVRDIVPAYCAVGVHFDPLLTDLAALERAIDEAARLLPDEPDATSRPVRDIAVRYGGAEGPDLEGVAEWAGCTAAEVIERHTATIYRVYMLGFVPGFAYMGRVDPRIAAPRHRVPRERVPAGSVGIAGEQTGVYPIASPGGWQLIGHTEFVVFDPRQSPPLRLNPGDRVRFVPDERSAPR